MGTELEACREEIAEANLGGKSEPKGEVSKLLLAVSGTAPKFQ